MAFITSAAIKSHMLFFSCIMDAIFWHGPQGNVAKNAPPSFAHTIPHATTPDPRLKVCLTACLNAVPSLNEVPSCGLPSRN
jgi:hypothetical protein